MAVYIAKGQSIESHSQGNTALLTNGIDIRLNIGKIDSDMHVHSQIFRRAGCVCGMRREANDVLQAECSFTQCNKRYTRC